MGKLRIQEYTNQTTFSEHKRTDITPLLGVN